MVREVLGGQAVMEGVLIKSAKKFVVAVRTEGGRIVVKRFRYVSWTKRFPLLNRPGVRGVILLVEMLRVGMRGLMWSAQMAGEEKEKEGGWGLFFAVLFSGVFAVVMFKFFPLWLAGVLQRFWGAGHLVFTVADGVLKVAILLGYLVMIGRLKEVRRLFAFHGAEHMAVHCYESGRRMTIKNVKGFSPEHPRCGTAFILLVFLISIGIYWFIPGASSFWEKLVWRVVLLPVVAGISYEILRAGGKYSATPGGQVLVAPGLWLQRLTTRRPSPQQMRVAIRAVKRVVE